MSRLYYLAASTIFLSSFLLFQVQPLIGKHILPWFGGSAAVWLTAMLFFMGALGLGYAYALLVVKLPTTVQLLAHGGFLLAVAGSLWRAAQSWASPITPDASVVLMGGDPSWAVVWVLVQSIGLPFVALSATSTLVQLWYGRLSQQEPYALYSVSNIGSLLGLLSYPFILERWLPTTVHGFWWTVGFGGYVILMVVLMAVYALRYRRLMSVREAVPAVTSQSLVSFAWWVGLTALPVMALVSGTQFLTTVIAPIPFLWVAPLALYLISFIVSFRGQSQIVSSLWYALLAVSGMVTLMHTMIPGHVVVALIATLVTVFAFYHVCHEVLYARRPDTEGSPLYYVAVAVGGIVGSLVVTISHLYVLTLPLEFPLLVSTGVLYALYRLLVVDSVLPNPVFAKVSPRQLGIVLMSAVVVLNGLYVFNLHRSALVAERNFFGAKLVIDQTKSDGSLVRVVTHGQTNHGAQQRKPADQVHAPISYYSPSSGVGRAVTALRERHPDGLNVAVLGLGGGGLAAYCTPDDAFTFIEIDPQMVQLAREYFTFLEYCDQAEVITADGRVALTALATSETPPQFDLIILDAYADDMMPMHLLTAEAVAVYRSLLAPGGVIAFNVSSRYLDLTPVLAAYEEQALVGRFLYDTPTTTPLWYYSMWGIFSTDETFFADDARWNGAIPFTSITPLRWTDTYSALFPVVKLW